MPPMFFSDLGVPPNLISGAEREREGRREGEREVEEEIEPSAEEGGGSRGLQDEENEKMKGTTMKKGTRDRGNAKKTGTKRGTDPRALPLSLPLSLALCIIAEPSTIPHFSAEQLLLAPGSESADKTARRYCAKYKVEGAERGEHYLLPSGTFAALKEK